MANAFFSGLLGAGLCQGDSSMPELTNPSPGSTLSGFSVVFNWVSNGVQVDDWYLRVGNTAGSTEYAAVRIYDPATTSYQVTGLPDDGRAVFVEFSYKQLTGEWVICDFLYIAFSSGGTL